MSAAIPLVSDRTFFINFRSMNFVVCRVAAMTTVAAQLLQDVECAELLNSIVSPFAVVELLQAPGDYHQMR